MSKQAAEVVFAAVAAGKTIATAESCTGGMVAVALTDIAGSSAAFLAGYVTYANSAKAGTLGVDLALIAAHGAVSEEVAAAMARGARRNSGADLAVSTTGIAGPGGSEFKPEGRVCFGLATASGVQTETVDFGALGRGEVRLAATAHALGLLSSALAGG